MTGQLYYPPANATAQRFDDDFQGIRWTGPAEKGCLHTTETTGWPGYGGGASAPNFTVKPNFTTQKLEWRQHYPANMSARALQNDRGGVETNKDKVIQVEIVGTCDPGAHKRWDVQHLYTPEAPGWFFTEMAKFFVWCYKEHGVALAAPGVWLHYGVDPRAPGRVPASYGNSPARMSGSQFNAFRGWLGHQHVAENDHGDPGKLDVARIITIAKTSLLPKPAERQEIPDMMVDYYSNGPYLWGPAGKRKVTKAAADEYVKAGVPVSKLSAAALTELPTFTEDGTVGGSTHTQLNTIERNTTPTPE